MSLMVDEVDITGRLLVILRNIDEHTERMTQGRHDS
jgi:hypothetical protein